MDKHTAKRIAALYALGAAVWIVSSDAVLTVLWDDATSHWQYGTAKGIAFVVLTTGLLYWLLVVLGAREQAKYRSLFRTNPHPMWVYDQRTRYFLTVNDAAVAHLGYSRAEFLKMTVDALVSRDHAPRSIVEYTSPVNAGYEPGLALVRRKDGTTLVAKTASHKVPFKGIGAMLVVAWDVTREVAAIAGLRESEERYRALVEQSIAGVLLVDAENTLFCNARAAEIFGYDVSEIVGRSPSIFLKGEFSRFHHEIGKVIAKSTAEYRGQFTCQRKDGKTIVIGLHAAKTEVDGNHKALIMLQDISERKRAEDKADEYAQRLEKTLMGTLHVVGDMIELRDPYTAGHEHRVGTISVMIGREMGLDVEVLRGLRVAAEVHDVGKIMVPSEILTKPGKLSATEYQLVQEHAEKGYEVLKSVDFPWPVAEVARQHHERMDGSGYPRGLAGEEILLEARIIAVADVVESMSAHRPYRAGLGLKVALDEIGANAGRLYDATVASACLKVFRNCTNVEDALHADGDAGEVAQVFPPERMLENSLR